MSKKITSIGLGVAALLVIAGAATFSWGVSVGEKHPKIITVQGVAGIESPEDQNITADFGTFWQVWDYIRTAHLQGGKVNDQSKVYGAIRGLVGSLDDPHSEFFSPENNKKFQEDIRGNFGGIGAEIGIRKNQLVVVAPLKDSPSSRAGLKPADKILKINSTSTADLTVDAAVRLIRGPEGTNVTLTIDRDAWEKPKEITITRATILIPTLDYEMKDDIAYLKLYSFNANTTPLFQKAALEIAANNARGMVLDLRNNPGGYLGVALDIAKWFFEDGTLIVKEEGKKEREADNQEFKTRGRGILADLPVVVIMNEGSASASEILAGALRDNRKVKLVGEKSFGKGTVQEIMELNDGSSLKLTVAHWVLPSGQVLENEGLKPDIEVKITDEDAENNRDPQLDKALEILRSQIVSIRG